MCGLVLVERVDETEGGDPERTHRFIIAARIEGGDTTPEQRAVELGRSRAVQLHTRAEHQQDHRQSSRQFAHHGYRTF